MLHCANHSRAALLALCLLSACAADDPADTAGPASRSFDGLSGQYLVGRFALARTDLPRAADGLLAALKSDPQNLQLRQEAFAAVFMTGRPEAVELAQQLPASPAAILVLADADVKAGNWAAAEAKFAALPGQGANQILKPLMQAWAQQGAGATDEALSTVRPFIEGTRYRGIFALHAAMIADIAGRTADAARLYRIAMVEYGALNLRLGMIAASWQARNGQGNEARATIHALVDAIPDLAIAEPALQQSLAARQVANATDGLAEAYLALAANLQQQDAPDFSLLLLRLALDLRPGFTAARLLTAEIQARSNHVEAAMDALAPVPTTDALYALIELRQAQYADREGHADQAQATLEHLATQYPDQPEPLALLGQMQRARGQFSLAADTYGRAIARVGRPGRMNWTLYYEQGVAYDRAHDWPKAEADFLKSLELSPDQPGVLNYLGYAWTEQGRNIGRARAMLERAVELRPNDGAIVDSLGWVLLQTGDHVGAVRFLEQAVELEPEDSTINSHLGDAYMAAGRRREAEIQWRRALILNPEPQDEKALLSKLAKNANPPQPPAVTTERRVE